MNHISESLLERNHISQPTKLVSTRDKRRQWLYDEFIQRMPGYSKSYICGGINNNPFCKDDDELEYVLGKAKESKNFIAYFKWVFYPNSIK